MFYLISKHDLEIHPSKICLLNKQNYKHSPDESVQHCAFSPFTVIQFHIFAKEAYILTVTPTYMLLKKR